MGFLGCSNVGEVSGREAFFPFVLLSNSAPWTRVGLRQCSVKYFSSCVRVRVHVRLTELARKESSQRGLRC